MKLTEKDKKLLYLLCILVIAAIFGFFIIKPQVEKRSDLEDMLSETENKKSSMEVMIATAPSSEAIIEESTESYDKLTADFYPLMNSNQMESVITEMVLGSNLTSLELDVSSQPEQADMKAYFASVKGQKALISEQTDAQNESDGAASKTQEEEQGTASNVYSFKVSVTATGTESDMKGLIDKICADCPAIRITGYRLNTKTGISASNEVKNVTSLMLDMEVYMAAK